MIKFLISLFKKEKTKEIYPFEFAQISLTNIAKSKGINDEFNKTIKIFKNGVLVHEMPYTKHLHNSIIETDKIPIFEEIPDEEDFEFDPFENLGGSKGYI